MIIIDTVKEVFDKYSDGYNCPFKMAENMNIIIIKSDLGSTNGYITYYKKSYAIGINSSLNDQEQKRVCFHEIGHRVLHSALNYSFLCNNAFFTASKYEKEADLFSIYSILSSYDKEEIEDMTLEDISYITTFPLKYINYIFCNKPIL